MVAGSDEDRRATGDVEGLERERQGVGVDAFLVEQVAGDQQAVRAALDGLVDRALQCLALVTPTLLAAVGRQPAERAAEMEVGDLDETDQAHALHAPP